MNKRRKFTAHYTTAVLHERTVGELTFRAVASTNSERPYQVGTYHHGFVDPQSIAVFQNPAAAIELVDDRADLAEEEPGFMPGLGMQP